MEAELMFSKDKYEELDISDVDMDRGFDEGRENETEHRRRPDLQNDRALPTTKCLQGGSSQGLQQFSQQSAAYTDTLVDFQIPSDVESRNERLEGKLRKKEEELCEANEKISQYEKQIQNLKEELSKEKQEHAKVEADLRFSQLFCDAFESVLLSEFSGVINLDEPWNVRNISMEKSLCLLQIQLSIKPEQAMNKTIHMQLKTGDGSVCWEKKCNCDIECGDEARKNIRVQLGIHGSHANIINCLTKASIRIEAYAGNNGREKNKQDCFVGLDQVLKDPNYTSPIATEVEKGLEAPESSLQGSLQLLFYSQDSKPPVADPTQIDSERSTDLQNEGDKTPENSAVEITAQNNHRTNGPVITPFTVPSKIISESLNSGDQTAPNNGWLDSVGVVPVRCAFATQNSAQFPDSKSSNSLSSEIQSLLSSFQNVPLDASSENCVLEQLDESLPSDIIQGNGSEVLSTTSPYANATTGALQPIIKTSNQAPPNRTELEPCRNTRAAEHSFRPTHSRTGRTPRRNRRDPQHSSSTTTESSVHGNTRLQPRGNNLVPPQQNGDGNDRPFKCPDCDQRFKHASSRSKHKLTHKDGNGKVPCEICGILISRRDALKRHMIRTHGEEPGPSGNKKYKDSAQKSPIVT